VGRRIGIDLGHTNCRAAWLSSPGAPQILPNGDNERFTPTLLALHPDGQVVAGRAAVRLADACPERVVGDVIARLGSGEAVLLNGTTMSPQSLAGHLLARFKQDAEARLNDRVAAALVAVPPAWDSAARQRLCDAGEQAQLAIQTVDAAVAAAVAAGVRQPSADLQNLLVYDLGGATFTVTALAWEKATLSVIRTASLQGVGGSSFDQQIVDYITVLIEQQNQVNPTANRRFMAELRRQAEQAKISLGAHNVSDVVIMGGLRSHTGAPIDVEIDIGREDFERLIEDKVRATIDLTRQVLADCRLSPSQVDSVILSGGTTCVPCVRRAVENLFGAGRMLRGADPLEGVALGAAWFLGELGISIQAAAPAAAPPAPEAVRESAAVAAPDQPSEAIVEDEIPTIPPGSEPEPVPPAGAAAGEQEPPEIPQPEPLPAAEVQPPVAPEPPVIPQPEPLPAAGPEQPVEASAGEPEPPVIPQPEPLPAAEPEPPSAAEEAELQQPEPLPAAEPLPPMEPAASAPEPSLPAEPSAEIQPAVTEPVHDSAPIEEESAPASEVMPIEGGEAGVAEEIRGEVATPAPVPEAAAGDVRLAWVDTIHTETRRKFSSRVFVRVDGAGIMHLASPEEAEGNRLSSSCFYVGTPAPENVRCILMLRTESGVEQRAVMTIPLPGHLAPCTRIEVILGIDYATGVPSLELRWQEPGAAAPCSIICRGWEAPEEKPEPLRPPMPEEIQAPAEAAAEMPAAAPSGTELPAAAEAAEELPTPAMEVPPAPPAAEPAAVTPPPEPKRLCGRYELRESLESGRYYELFLSRDPDSGADAMLTLYTAGDDRAKSAFLSSLLPLSIDHPNVLGVRDFGRALNSYYLVSDYSGGATLRDLMGSGPERQPVPVAKILNLIVQVCEGLQALHAHGIFHRNLKPSNVMLDAGLQVAKIADFQIAVFLRGRDVMTQVAGTLPYMAKEVLEGRADFRSDIYSVGVMLYELLAGKLPFWATSQRVLVEQITSQPVAEPRSLCPKIPEYVNDAVLRALDKDPARRFQSAVEFRDALTREPGPWFQTITSMDAKG